MLRICLLTIEDENPQPVYEAIRSQLASWLFVRKGVVRLSEPTSPEHCWVTNLADWRRVIAPLAAEHDLVFCTVDLRIPEQGHGRPDMKNGLAIVREVKARHDDGVRCCVLTGMTDSSLQGAAGDSITDVLFDFKSDDQAYWNIVNYIKSQALLLTGELDFLDSAGRKCRLCLRENSGRLRDQFLSRASYFADEATWHVPTLLIGQPGLGRRTLAEFIAYLAGAELIVIDLASKENRDHFAQLQTLQREIEAGPGPTAPRRLYYIANLDAYMPGLSGEERENCLWPLRRILETVGGEPGPVGLMFSISGDVRLRIRDQQTRSLIRLLEDTIGRVTGFPLTHLGTDEHGWPLDHPRIVRLPALAERGKEFIHTVAQQRLDALGGETRVRLESDVRDLLLDRTDWSSAGNLAGLISVLDRSHAAFVTGRATHQMEITRAHLPVEVQTRLQKTVFNVTEVQLRFEGPTGKPLQVISRADLHVQEGELLVILGPSGCGKSTLLRMLAGLLKPTEGSITFRGELIRGPSAKVGFIFQDYSLFPWLTVRGNVEFGPRATGEHQKLGAPIDRLLEVAGLEGFDQSYPHHLSGGMRQRVAIIRALANDPVALLMDEPFGALDVQRRWEMQDFLIRTKQRTGKTIVFVTHDVDEAVYVADRIYIATPRPMRLAREFVVPFSTEARRTSLREDGLYVRLVGQVREALLATFGRMKEEG